MGLKTTINDMKNTIEGFSNRLEEAKQTISELDPRAGEITYQSSNKRMNEKKKKRENSLRDF